MKGIYRRLTDNKMGIFIFLTCWMVYFTSYIGRYNYSAAMAGIIEEGVLPFSQVGIVGTAYFLCYGLGQIINGFMGDKLSPFTMIFLGLLSSSTANMAMTFLGSYGSMAAVWAINGFAQSMIWSPILRIFSEILPIEQQNKACINIASTIPAGTLASYALSTLMMWLFSWRIVFLSAGIFMAVVAFIWLFSSKRILKWSLVIPGKEPFSPEDYSADKTQVSQTEIPVRPKIMPLLLSSGVMLLLVPIAIHGILKDGMTSWVPTFISETFKTAPSLSVVFTMVLPIVNLSGAYAADWLNRKVFHNETLACAALFLLSVAALGAMLLFGGMSIIITVVCLSLVTSSMMGINTLVISIIPVRLGRKGGASTISGVLNAIAYLGCAFSTWGIGWCVERFGWQVTTLAWVLLAVAALLFTLTAIKPWKNWCQRFDSGAEAAQ